MSQPIPTPRCDRALVRKPDEDGRYIPHSTGASIERELLEMIARHTNDEDLAPGDICELVFRIPGIEQGFVHQVFAYDRVKVAKDGGSTKPEGLIRRLEWRVCLYGYKAGQVADRTDANLKTAIALCLEVLNLKVPPALR